MSLTSSESRDLHSIAESLKKLVTVVETMNTNLVTIGRNLVPPKIESNETFDVVNGAGEVIHTIKSSRPDVGLPIGWTLHDTVRVTDPSREEFGLYGIIVDGRIWSTNVELLVRFGDEIMGFRKLWFNPSQLEKKS